MKLIIIRHGKTIENKLGIITGQLPGSLSPEGVKYAHKLGKSLKNKKIDFIYSSPLKRAADTAKIIKSYLPKSILRFRNELKEMSFGALEGKKTKKDNAFLLAYKMGGESVQKVYNRAKKFLRYLKKKHKNDTILIIGHATINRALVCALKNLPTERALKIIKNPKYIVKGIFILKT